MLKDSLLSTMGHRKILLGGVVFGLVIWVAEGMLHFIVFDRLNAINVLFPATMHELWMRSLVTGLFIGFGTYTQIIINKLHDSKERYRTLFETAPDAIFLADAESGEILDANPAASELLLRPHEEIVGYHQSQLYAPVLEDDSKILLIDQVKEIRRGKEVQPVEHVAFRSDGREVPVEMAAQFVHLEDRSTVQCILRDLTSRKKAEESLTVFRKFAEASSQGLGMVDLEGKIIYCNDTLCRVFLGEEAPQKALGKNVSCYHDEKSARKLKEQVLPCVLEMGQWTGEIPLVSLDGKVTDAIQSIFLIRNDKGEPIYIANVVTDITEQNQIREALQQSEQKYRSLFDNMLDGFAYHRIIVDEHDRPVDYEFLEINDAFECFTDLRRQEVIGKRVTQVIPGIQDSGFDWIGEYGKVALEGRQSRFVQHSKELNRWYSISAYSPQRGYFAATFRDETERKRIEIALKESEEQVRLLLDSTAEAIFGLDLEGNCTFCNSACLDMLAYGNDTQLLGKNLHTLIHQPRPDGSVYPVEQCRIFDTILQDKGTHVDDEVLWRADGTSFPVEYWSYPIQRDGDVVGSVVTFLDITERKQVMEEVEAYREKMFRAEQLASIGTIGSGLAHQLNQPLSVIRMSIQKALRNLDKIDCPDIVKEVLSDGLGEVSRASAVTREFLALGHMFSGGRITRVDIYEMAQRTLSAFSQMVNRVGIKCITDNLKTLPAITGVASELEQMFFILVQNAIQAANADKRQWFTISGRVEMEQIKLIFADNCGGIAPDHIDKIFDPFFTTKSVEQGTGLGLAILQQIVTNHNGSVRVESKLGLGSSFYVNLPIERQ